MQSLLYLYLYGAVVAVKRCRGGGSCSVFERGRRMWWRQLPVVVVAKERKESGGSNSGDCQGRRLRWRLCCFREEKMEETEKEEDVAIFLNHGRRRQRWQRRPWKGRRQW